MKLLITALLLIVFCACNNADKNEALSMPGTYKMLYQKVKGGKTDTTFTSLQQLKIYTSDYMMYANFNPADSTSNFGIGTYTKTADTVIEKVFYNGSDSTKSETIHNFKLIITKTETGYKQIIPDIPSAGESFSLTEEYESVGTTAVSPLDGAWKMDKAYYIKGKDTSMQHTAQFKTYNQGYFIWGHTYEDSTGKTHTGTGFGTFTLNGNDKLIEKATESTYAEVRGHDFAIALEMDGADAFKQTITNKDSSVQVEYYKRLKK